MMDKGEFAEAAQLFVRLSEGARRRGMPIRAANLAARASQAYLAQDRPDSALDQIRLAIRILVRQGQPQRAARLASGAVDKLKERGFQTEADELTAYANRLRDEAGLSPGDWQKPHPSQPSSPRGTLPDRCSGCGASLIPDDVIWHDDQTAECTYCGAVVKTV